MFEHIPDKMKSIPNWVLWKLVNRNGKKTKIPYQTNGIEARVHDPYTWNRFESVYGRFMKNNEYAGIGFVFSKSRGLMGVDFDHVKDLNTGKWNDAEIQDALSIGSYTEISPSGDGLHVICSAIKPGVACKAGNHEMYDSVHYFTVTGDRFPGSNPNISPSQPAIDRLYAKWFSSRCGPSENYHKTEHVRHTALNPVNPPIVQQTLTDTDIINICNNAKNSVKFKRLFSGDRTGYPSPSEADFALCRILAFYSSDPDQIERIARSSGLSRTKWNQPGYISTTVKNALKMGGVRYGN